MNCYCLQCHARDYHCYDSAYAINDPKRVFDLVAVRNNETECCGSDEMMPTPVASHYQCEDHGALENVQDTRIFLPLLPDVLFLQRSPRRNYQQYVLPATARRT